MSDFIYHLAEPGDWARSTDTYRPPSVDEEGLIHCSIAEQLRGVAHDRFAEHNGLILLTIDPRALDDASLVFEDLYDLGWDFPHVYGPLPTSAVVGTGPYLTHLEEGLWMDQRYDQEWMDRILHPEFTEVGRSGRTYDRRETIESGPPRKRFEVKLPHLDYELQLIDEDVALVRYISRPVYDGVERLDQRTSVWINTNEGWRLRFHQATAISAQTASR